MTVVLEKYNFYFSLHLAYRHCHMQGIRAERHFISPIKFRGERLERGDKQAGEMGMCWRKAGCRWEDAVLCSQWYLLGCYRSTIDSGLKVLVKWRWATWPKLRKIKVMWIPRSNCDHVGCVFCVYFPMKIWKMLILSGSIMDILVAYGVAYGVINILLLWLDDSHKWNKIGAQLDPYGGLLISNIHVTKWYSYNQNWPCSIGITFGSCTVYGRR